MRRRVLLCVVLVLLTAGHAAAATDDVSIHNRVFSPGRLTVLLGDTVTWTNHDPVAHNVVAGSFSSALLAPDDRFTHTFTTQGSFPYVCTIHRQMRGEIDVFALLLSGPGASIRPGEQAMLTGLAPAGTGPVEIQAKRSDGGYGPVVTVVPGADGAFSAAVAPELPTEYRAVAGELVSPTVLVSVSARVRFRVAGIRGATLLLRVEAVPAQPGARVALERYVRERFMWERVVGTRLGDDSRVVLRLTPRRRVLVRASLVEGVGGYGPAVSPARWVGPPR